MKKIIIKCIVLGFIILTCMFEAFALQTYVGVKIVGLSDDPASSCANVGDYGPNGRIRAISSILPEYPLYFELRNASNDGLIWSGNSTQDIDYKINDTILLPQQVDLTLGESYKLFFDFDAIKIYLPLVNDGDFEKTINNTYWTAGIFGSGSNNERSVLSGTSDCVFSTHGMQRGSYYIFVSNLRSNLTDDCMGDTYSYNCINQRGIQVTDYYGAQQTRNFKISSSYNNLKNSGVGNVNLVFTFS